MINFNTGLRSIFRVSILSLLIGSLPSLSWAAQTPTPCTSFPSATDLAAHPPDKLSETGVFSDLKSLQSCPKFLPFSVQAPLWSDGAAKQRWIALPGNEKIIFQPNMPWTFPIGTVLVKHFEIQVPDHSSVRIETRLLILASEDEWVGFTYRWNEDQKDASLIGEAPYPVEAQLKIPDPSASGGYRTQTWQFPTRTDCNRCHNPVSGGALGPRTEQLNFTDLNEKNQLETWDARGMFSTRIGATKNYPAYVNPYDSSADLNARARSYMATNCAHCHQPGAPVPSNMDLRFQTPLKEMHAVNSRPMTGDLGVPNAYIIKAGKKDQSVFWHRLSRRGGPSTRQMPPIATLAPDSQAVELIGRWIDRLKP